MKLARFMMLALLALAACDACGPSLHPAPGHVATGVCEAAQANLEALGCTWSHSPKGVPFAVACRNVAEGGIDLAPSCIAKAKTCAEAAQCRP